ncbi:MAG: hypothetical protein GF418_10730 [Chitinivibrionales bacterium]|nr:hypothetical protein [Chitinivibrionales bacterium]MBD3396089.1 hypothetical protein [Chitinivibrionales bacterium]
MGKHFQTVAAIVTILCVGVLAQQEIILKADDVDDHDDIWGKRYAAGVNSWGIDGNHIPGTNGYMIWNSFPGPSGTYSVKLGAVTEPDGDSPYKFFVDGQEVASGNYPYSTGNLDCGSGELKVEDIDLGEHAINNGDEIKYWASSVYPCGTDHGQYSRFYQIKFTSQAPPDNTPPSVPANVAFVSATNTSITVSWDGSTDDESGVKEYLIYVDNTQKGSSTNTQGTATGLSRNTEYEIAVSAVNYSGEESARSAAITASTADEDAPTGTMFLAGNSGTLANGMTEADAAGALAPKAIYGTNGSTSGASASLSKAEYDIDVPVDGTWYFWARLKYEGGMANSFWVDIDGGDAMRFGNGESQFSQWHWEGFMEEGHVDLGSLTAGPHTLTVYCREPADDCLLDVICLTTEESYEPSDGDVVLDGNGTTPMEGYVRVDYPTGGETLQVGQTITVRWTTDTNVVTDVDVKFSPDGGVSWETLNGSGSVVLGDADWDNLEWTIPETVLDIPLAGNSECIMRVEQYEATESDYIDNSDAFSIVGQGQSVVTAAPVARESGVSIHTVSPGWYMAQVALENAYDIRISDPRGATVAHFTGTGPARYALPQGLASGVYVMSVKNRNVVRSGTLILKR